MRKIKRTLTILGLVGLIALLTLTLACGGDSGTDENGDNGDTSTATDTNGDDGGGEEATPSPTNTPAPAGIGGAPLPEEWDGAEGIAATESSADMTAIGADGFSGTLHLIQIERKTKVTITLDDAGPGPYAAAIRRGGCPEDGSAPSGQFDYILFDIADGESVSLVNTPAQFFQFSLAYIVVVGGEDLENDPAISCGNIPSPLR